MTVANEKTQVLIIEMTMPANDFFLYSRSQML